MTLELECIEDDLAVVCVTKITSTAFQDSVRTAQDIRYVLAVKASQLMLHRKGVAVCSEIPTAHKHTVCGRT
jgi:hypothetical protein